MTSHAFKALQKNTILSKSSNRTKWRCSRFEREFEARNRPHKPPTILPAQKERPCRDIRLLHNFVSSPSDSRLSKMEHLQGLLALLRITDDVISPATKDEIHQAVDKLLLSLQKKRPVCEILDSESEQPPPAKRPKLVSSSKSYPDHDEVLEAQVVVQPTSGDISESKSSDVFGPAVLLDKPKTNNLKKNLSNLSTDRKNSPLHGDAMETKYSVLPNVKDNTPSNIPKNNDQKKKLFNLSNSRKISPLHGEARETKPSVQLNTDKSDKPATKKSDEFGLAILSKKPSIVELKKKFLKPAVGRNNSPLHGDAIETKLGVLLAKVKCDRDIKQKCTSVSDTQKNENLQRDSDSILNQVKKDFKNKRRQISVKASTMFVTLNNNITLAPEDLRNRLLNTQAQKETEQSEPTAVSECIINDKDDPLVVLDRSDTKGHKPKNCRTVLLNSQNAASPVADTTPENDAPNPVSIALECTKPSQSEEELRNKLLSKMVGNRQDSNQIAPFDKGDGKNNEFNISEMGESSVNTPASDMIVAELLQMVENDAEAKKQQKRKALKKELKKEKKKEKKLAKKLAKKAKKLAAKKNKLYENLKITMAVRKYEPKDAVEPTRKVLIEVNNASVTNSEKTAKIEDIQTYDRRKEITDNANNNAKLCSHKDDVRKVDSNEKEIPIERVKLGDNISTCFASKDKYVVCITGDGIVKRSDAGKYSMTKLMISQDELRPRRLRRRTKIVKTVRSRQVEEQLYKHVLKKVARDTAESKGLECCAAKCWRYNVKFSKRFARK